MDNMSRDFCIFCEAITNIDSSSNKILKFNDKYAVLADNKPACLHHYLVIPRKHVRNAKTLSKEDIVLIEEMHMFGKAFLTDAVQNSEDLSDCRFGFHFPPYTSCDHLHLHVLCPSSSIKQIYTRKYEENTWYFVSPEKLIEILNKG